MRKIYGGMLTGIMLLLAFSQGNCTVYAKITTEKLVRTSTIIAKVKVLDEHSEWNSTKTKINTFVHIQVLETIKGNNVPRELTITVLGGYVGTDAMIIDGSPVFNPGEDALVFLVYHKGKFWVHSLGLGKFDLVEKNGQMVAENKTINPSLIVSSKLQTLSSRRAEYNYEQFKTEIKSLVK